MKLVLEQLLRRIWINLKRRRKLNRNLGRKIPIRIQPMAKMISLTCLMKWTSMVSPFSTLVSMGTASTARAESANGVTV
jgi:hypothetical protein